MSDSLHRQFVMLQNIPMLPSKITVSNICQALASEGFIVDKRTVERDLRKLEDIFSLQCDDRSIPHGWSFSVNALTTMPKLDYKSALTFALSEQYLHDFLPPTIYSHLKPYFLDAKKQLSRLNNKKYGNWLNKITHLPRGIRLRPAKINKAVVSCVYDALLNNYQLELSYKGYDKQIVHPLGIVLKGPVIYLVCTFWDYQSPRQIALHRIEHVRLLNNKSNILDDFDLYEYAHSGAFEFLDTKTKIRIHLKFYGRAINHLFETPLSDDQSIKEINDNENIVTATVLDTQDLRWWILGFGSNVEVQGPKRLRNEIKKEIANMSNYYV